MHWVILGVFRVDLFVLDIEGAEFAILETIPFQELDIRHIYIEVDKAPKQKVKDLLAKYGYSVTKEFFANTLFSKTS